MGTLAESASWEAGIYQLETSDPVLGGPDGIDNLQAKQLANRTLYLKGLVEALTTGKQPLDATLTALAGVVTAANQMLYSTGPDAFATTSLSAFIRTLLDDADAAAARTTLGAAPLASPAFTGTPTVPTAAVGTNTTQAASTAFAQAAVGIGQVSMFAMSTPPAGWLKANGAAISRATYAALFAAIGTTFGAGDGSTTFNVPDMRGEFARGWDDARGVDIGRLFGSAQTDEFKKHRHPQYEYDSGNSVPIPDGSLAYDLNASITTGYERTALIGYAGGTETRPRNIAMLACIKY